MSEPSKGIYALVLHLEHREEITVGKLGTVTFPAGYYLYVGSALGPGGLEARLAQLHELGLLDAETTRQLREGWNFLQQLGNRLRIVENRSISDLDAERGDLDGVAQSLGYVSSGREAGARRTLLNDYQRITESIRSIYLEVLGVED